MIPRGAALWGILGLVPFLAGASLANWPLENSLLQWLAADNRLLLHYGMVIFCFMAGVLWGFATRAEGSEATRAYTLSVLPAGFAAFALAPVHDWQLPVMMGGFAALLLLDFWFWNEGLAPRWWLRFRIMLSVVVLASLAMAL